MDTEGLADLGHAFISYVRQDMAQVERLDRDLRLAGIHVWRDVRDLWPGEPWKIKIREAIRHRSFAFLVCFSQNSLAKQKTYQYEELAIAAEEYRIRPPDRPWIFPIRFHEVEIPYFDLGAGRELNDLGRCDLFGPTRDSNMRRLIDSIRRVAAVPAFPAGAQPEGREPRATIEERRVTVQRPIVEGDDGVKFVAGIDVASGLDSRPDVLALTPVEFEHLIRQLFEAVGMRSWVTQASRDDGVDVVAVNEDPLVGGLCIIQAKRYRRIVGLETVHALAGVMQDMHAAKGVLVTTSWVGAESRDFAARNGRIEIIEGRQLKSMLREHLGLDVLISLPESPPD